MARCFFYPRITATKTCTGAIYKWRGTSKVRRREAVRVDTQTHTLHNLIKQCQKQLPCVIVRLSSHGREDNLCITEPLTLIVSKFVM